MTRHVLIITLLVILLTLSSCVKENQHLITLTANPAEGGQVSGSGKYFHESQVTAIATSNRIGSLLTGPSRALSKAKIQSTSF